MAEDDRRDEWVRQIERLEMSAEDKAFLVSVRKQFEAEVAAQAANTDKPSSRPEDQ
jgi:hypothetical protein